MVITLCLVTLAIVAALGYLASGARKIDVRLDSLLHAQREQRNEVERDVEQLRQNYNRT